MRLLAWLLDLFFPPKCVFCGKLLAERETDLCTKCKTSLPVMLSSVKRGEFYNRCWPVYAYEGHVADSIRRFKFHGARQYAPAYGRQLAMVLLRNQVEFDVLTWVPSSDKRCRQRGYDQSQLLAEATAQALGVECIRTLKKVVDTKPQTRMNSAEARQGNVRGAFAVWQPERFSGKRILLIDDVITSGATLSECSAVLKIAGAAGVETAVLAAAMIQETK